MFFRVLLVGFGLFELGAARALISLDSIYIHKDYIELLPIYTILGYLNII